MDTGISIKITSWTIQIGATSIQDFEGIEDFRKELAEHYISAIHRRPAGRGGGLYQLAVELLSNVSLSDVATWLSGGIAFDMLKSGSKVFILRPFLAAYKKLRERNQTHQVRISELRVVFQDSMLIIYDVCDDGVFQNLERILVALAEHYAAMALGSGEKPFEIHVPIFEDKADDRIIRFRVLLDVDETIRNVTPSDYFKLWGLWYDYSRRSRVFDISRDLFIDEEFFTQERYWSEWEKRYLEGRYKEEK